MRYDVLSIFLAILIIIEISLIRVLSEEKQEAGE